MKSIGFVYIQNNESSTNRTFCRFNFEGDKIAIDISIAVTKNMNWELFVKNKLVPKSCPIIKEIPTTISDSNLNLWSKLKDVILCPGNEDFADVLEKKIHLRSAFKDNYVIEDENGTLLEKNKFSIVRAINCERLIPKRDFWCMPCKNLQKSLLQVRRRFSTETEDRTSTSSRVGFKYLTEEESIKRVENLQKERNQLMQKNKKLEASIEKLTKAERINVDEDLLSMFRGNTSASRENTIEVTDERLPVKRPRTD